MNSIPENYIEEKQFNDRINLFFRKFKIYQALQHANAYKKRGVPVIQIFLYLFSIGFHKQKYVYEPDKKIKTATETKMSILKKILYIVS
ncbi:MAG: hypothetical protein ACOX3Q_03085 [Clostridia bacterium]